VTARILLVDDEPDLEALVTQKFRREIRDGSLSFEFAHDGVEALAAIASGHPFDLMLSDINMPRMDGLSLIEKLQETNADLATVIVSAYGDIANVRTAMNRGAFDFLMKPIDFADLETTIAKTLKHVEALREARRRQVAAERAHASLSRYFSPRLAERLVADADVETLAGERREVSTLFTDIAGFTHLAETVEPLILTKLLNEYLSGMTEIVFAHDGTVTKIIGDALHVLFGAPADQPDHSTTGLACALALDRFAEDFRKTWVGKGIAVGLTRIGVHAGPAIVGNFGGARFFDYTAYGDTINVAARLESANKELGTRTCASEAIMKGAPEIRGRPIGDLVLRGRDQPLKAFEPLTRAKYEAPSTQSYLKAFALLERGNPTALAAFAGVVAESPDDPLAGFHLKRLLNGATGVRVAIE
jgi:adenylate cyclase